MKLELITKVVRITSFSFFLLKKKLDEVRTYDLMNTSPLHYHHANKQHAEANHYIGITKKGRGKTAEEREREIGI